MASDPTDSRTSVILRAIAALFGLALSAFMLWLAHAILVSPIDGPRAMEIALRCFGGFMFGSIALAGLWPIVDAVRVPSMLRSVGPRCPACGEVADVVSRETTCGECGYAVARQPSRWRFEAPDRYVLVVASGVSVAVFSLGVFMLTGVFDHPSTGAIVASVLLAALMIPVGAFMIAVYGIALGKSLRQPSRFVFRDEWSNEQGKAHAWAEVTVARGGVVRAKGETRTPIALPRALAEDGEHARTDFERGLAAAIAQWHTNGAARLGPFRDIVWTSLDPANDARGVDRVVPVAYRIADEPVPARERVERTDRTVWTLALASGRTLRSLLTETVSFDWPPVELMEPVDPDHTEEEDVFGLRGGRLDLNAVIGAIESVGDLRRAIEALGRRAPRGGAEMAMAEWAVAGSR